jgi:hypothetical protein
LRTAAHGAQKGIFIIIAHPAIRIPITDKEEMAKGITRRY